MQHRFAAPESLWAEFVRQSWVFVAIAAVMGLVLWLDGRRRVPRGHGLDALLVAGLILAAGAWWLKPRTLDRFWQIEASRAGVTLQFRHAERHWPTGEVSELRYAYEKPWVAGPCHLTVELADGQTFHSADERMSIEACKALRLEVLKALGR